MVSLSWAAAAVALPRCMRGIYNCYVRASQDRAACAFRKPRVSNGDGFFFSRRKLIFSFDHQSLFTLRWNLI